MSVNGACSNVSILYNYIHHVGNTISGYNVHSVIYSLGSNTSSDIVVSHNKIDEIGNPNNNGKSCAAIGFLDSSASGTLTGLNISNNYISNVDAKTASWTEGGRIAYGVIINVGGSSGFNTSGKVVNAVVENNSISYLEGFIATGIGLEGNTENAIAKNNSVSYLTGYKVADRDGGGYDLNGIKLENNRYVGTVSVENNALHTDTFTVNSVSPLGYAVSNYVPSSYGTLDMSGNWYGTADITEIMDNEDLDGRVFCKTGCLLDFLPFSTSADPLNTDGLGPVLNSTQEISYMTIQAAINAADPGDVIEVAPGTYHEHVVLNVPNLTLVSTGGSDVTIIDRPAGTLTTAVNILANLGTVTIDGFTIQGWTESGIVQNMSAATGTKAIVKNNKVISNGTYMRNGIQVSGDYSDVESQMLV